MSNSSLGSAVARIVVTYVIFAAIWILVSDSELARLTLDAGTRTQWGIYKGLAYILVTALLLTALLRRELLIRARTQGALEDSETRFRAYVEQAADALFVLDSSARVIDVNPHACRTSGYTRDELLRMTVFDLAPGLEPALVKAALVEMQPGAAVTASSEVRRKDGSTSPIEVRFGCFDLGGERRYMALARDLTERLKAEEELRRLHAALQHLAEGLEGRVAERTAALAEARDRAEVAHRMKSAFLATMSHELRSPLNTIIGFTDVLLQGLSGPLNEEQTTQLSIVKDSGTHLLALINDVLDISKIEAGQIDLTHSVFDLREIVEKVARAIAPQAARKGLRLETKTAPGVGEITSDRRRLEQVLLNLVGNAVKFTARGSVVVQVEQVPSSPTREAPSIRVSVADTGCGVHPDELGRLFQPFSQLGGPGQRDEGTGLGLAISRRLVERLGGTIEVASEPGRGSTFSFTVPLAPTTLD